jgi:uncharacterized cupin superfamily protein
MPKLDLSNLTPRTGSNYPAPFAAMMAGRQSLRLGEAGGLTQFGANIIILAPGALSSLRHWHEKEDEFVMILSGACTLVQDAGPVVMQAGDCAAFPAGLADGHHLHNHTEAEARFLVIGTKAASEVAHYSDFDLKVVVTGKSMDFQHRDGRPYSPEVR